MSENTMARLFSDTAYELYGLIFFGLQSFEVFFPLHRQKIFFLVVASLAGRYSVPLSRLPPPDERDDMVHRKFFRRKFSLAKITDAFRTLPLPPL